MARLAQPIAIRLGVENAANDLAAFALARVLGLIALALR